MLAYYFNIVKRIWKLYSWIRDIEINVTIIFIIKPALNEFIWWNISE